jgi:enamine deaminase RidA (YjgF/YER057c/UK114 family)
VATPSERLRELGITLPPVSAPAGAYIPAKRSGDLVFTSGQVPVVDGRIAATGKVGAEIDVARAAELARTCALSALAAVDALVGIDSITGVVKLVGFVASAPGFTDQPEVINGASDVLGEIFGETGAHARSAVGVAELPRGVPVEVEIVVQVGSGVSGP